MAGNNFDDYNPNRVEVTFAKSEEQAKRDGTPQCLYPVFPNDSRIYFDIEKLDDNLCVSKKIGWEREICVRKADIPRLIEILYPNGVGSWDYQSLIDKIEGDLVWIIGFGD